MNKKALSYGLIILAVILLSLIFISSKKEYEKPINEVIENSDVDNKAEEFSTNDIDITKDIAIKFSENIYSCDTKNPLDFPNKAIEYTTESLSNRIIQIAKTTKPEVYKRSVVSTNAIEPKIDSNDGIVIWSLELMSNIYNENDEIIGREKGNINVVFAKENDKLKVVEYAIRRYPKDMED